MGYLSEGLYWGLRPSFVKALWSLNDELRGDPGDMQRASLQFLQRMGYSVEVARPWSSAAGRIVFVSDHVSALDGFALAAACPSNLTVRRVVFLLTALGIGRNFFRHSILVWPRGNYHNLIYRSRGFVDRVAYLISHRWGPWVRHHRGLDQMRNVLNRGECLTLLPSGTVGDPHWRSGIGGLLQAQAAQDWDYFLAPVYLHWNQKDQVLKVESPFKISMRDLLAHAPPTADRNQLAAWLRDCYTRRSWPGT